MQDIDQARFGELRLRQRRGDAQDRLVGKEHRAFRHGVDVAAEAEVGEIIEQVVAEPAGAPEPGDLRGREARVFKKIERLLQPGGEEKAAAGRQRADEELEYRGFRLAMIQVGLHHVELVKVRQQRVWGGSHC